MSAPSSSPQEPTGPKATRTHAHSLVASMYVLGREDLALAGGKGANLGALIRAGFPVPDGVVVTTEAYDRFVAHAGLGPLLAAAAREGVAHGEALRRAFEAATIPDDIARAITVAAQDLGRGPLAVRSSATAEDLPEAAFAGQQDTFLNVIGVPALLAAVRRCWASLWTDRAILYRERQGLDHAAIKIAVVLQRMLDADVAGVLFTANPLTGAEDETVIDASPGLGEAVVSGLVTPDHFVLRKRLVGYRIVTRRFGRRELLVRSQAGGGIEHLVSDALPGSTHIPALPDHALRTLARLGARIARHFGAPQDIEWAFVGSTPWILQARPITALPQPKPRAPIPKENPVAQFADMLSVRPYPMDLTTWGPGIYDRAVVPSFSHLGITTPGFEEMFTVEDSVIVRMESGLKLRPTPRLLLGPARFLWLCARHDPRAWRSLPDIDEARARARALEARDLASLSWDELLATVHEALALPRALLGEARTRFYPRAMLSLGLLKTSLWMFEHEDRLDLLLSGLDTRTLEANRALAALAAKVRSTPSLAATFAQQDPADPQHDPAALHAALSAQPEGRALLADLRAFLDHYGHREAVMFTLVEPTWKDAPEVVLGMLRSLSAVEPPEHRPGPTVPSWEAARDDLLTHPVLRPAPLRAAFLQILDEARTLPEIREDTHFYGTLPMPILRRTLLELGRRLQAAQVLDAPEDIFHLRLEEVERVGGVLPPPADLTADLRARVARRRALRDALTDTPVVDPALYRHSAHVPSDVLVSGTPGSPGIADGPACVVRSVQEFGKLRPGDVLVAPFTNPAWTPLFQRAAAVVVDTGAQSSHAAIVAREYGIPAVMGTGDGTRRLKEGVRIRVDGLRGLVLPAPPADEPAHHSRRPIL
ncbi:PEP/pyruvate-binding domain-containing protein [Chondromyces apiculatus]|uniref:Phosphoenolpyruvate synthase n=1 Tax=Chondromyces apiculatus DSM 436 TaxID=1192034 RepID=A0A017T0Q4_9BACT|nr:PEP/pyruvate-binding domain-containing protein [Chondromyces apiculatus]EYF02121.1 Phosphoenolpyruvate synthase [Chondromyces apiculatus DSM 436]